MAIRELILEQLLKRFYVYKRFSNSIGERGAVAGSGQFFQALTLFGRSMNKVKIRG
ncbi:MAG: hypothetical protein P8M68_04525 [Aquiluna sp.]|nr:hypothetical protein [Aquiluna sp.]